METRTEPLSLSARAPGTPNINNLITWVKYYNQMCIFSSLNTNSHLFLNHVDILVSVSEMKCSQCPSTCPGAGHEGQMFGSVVKSQSCMQILKMTYFSLPHRHSAKIHKLRKLTDGARGHFVSYLNL